MKLSSLVVLMIAAAAAGVSAQKSVHFSGGMNISSITDSDTIAVSSSSRTGFNSGMAFERNMGPFSILTGFSFETRGEKEEKVLALGALFAQNQIEEVNTTYLQIPLLGQFNLPMGPVTLNLFAGPDMGILLLAKEVTAKTTRPAGRTDTIVGLPTKDTVDVAKQMSMLDLGITAGAGCEFTAGPGALFIRPSYYYGIRDFRDYNEGNTNSGRKGANRNIKISLGYKFNLPK